MTSLGLYREPSTVEAVRLARELVRRLGKPCQVSFVDMACSIIGVQNVKITYGATDPEFWVELRTDGNTLSLRNQVADGVHHQSMARSLTPAVSAIQSWVDDRQPVRVQIGMAKTLVRELTKGLPWKISEASYSTIRQRSYVQLVRIRKPPRQTPAPLMMIRFGGGRLIIDVATESQAVDLADPDSLDRARNIITLLTRQQTADKSILK